MVGCERGIVDPHHRSPFLSGKDSPVDIPKVGMLASLRCPKEELNGEGAETRKAGVM
jgi:hypothetical protein